MLYYAFYCDKISAIKSNTGRQICRQTFMRTGSGCSLRSSKKIPWHTVKKSKAFYISRANIKSATNCPLLIRALRALKKMTAGAGNMMHTPGSIKN